MFHVKLASWKKEKEKEINKHLNKYGSVDVLCEHLDISPFILELFKNKKVFFLLDEWQIEEVRSFFDIQKTTIGFFPQKPKNRDSGGFIDYDLQTYRVNINKAASAWEKINLFLIDKKTYKTPCLPTKKKKEKAYKAGDFILMEDFLKTLNALGYKKTEEASFLGSYVVRGGAIDLIPYSLDKTVRFSFLDDQLEIFFVEGFSLKQIAKGKEIIVSRETVEREVSLKSKKNKNFLFCKFQNGLLSFFYDKKTSSPLIKVYKKTFGGTFYKKTKKTFLFSSHLSSRGLVLEKDIHIAPAWYKNTPDLTSKNLFVHEMRPGDFFVHDGFGFCEFVGVDNSVKNEEKLCLRFADGLIKIHVSSISDLSFYGDKTKNKKLSFLSKKGVWKRIKKRHVESAGDIAFSLFSKQEQRKKIKKEPLKIDAELDKMFSSFFKHKETKDQERAIKDVCRDLTQNHPTTRLLCGDVGFGKTEVALRAVFVCCYNNKKTIVVAPTKILSKQLFDEFSLRLASFGFKVTSSLSAFLSEKNDVLVSTHKVLNSNEALRSCSFFVVDEEHRFGVNQKEKIVSVNPFSDILYMSATPLPRSLQLAISKQRNITQINTPPLSKKQTLTRIYYYNKNLVLEIINNEIKRRGQVFFVDNSVYNVKKAYSFILEAFPFLRVSFLHSKQDDGEIIKTMALFRNKKIDVLVSTTIIESGIDVGSANTIIINNADCFGLSQLYQLRGRVGRGSVQAHAFLLVSKKNHSTATPRLSSLMKNQSLGSGYNVAVDDLNIRGAGAVFGLKQSGSSAVGFEYYSKLVALAIKNNSGNKDEKTNISLHPGSVPGLFSPSSAERVSIYSYISSCNSVDELDLYYKNYKSIMKSSSLSFKSLVFNRQIELLTLNSSISDVSFSSGFLSILINKGSFYFSSSLPKRLNSFLNKNKYPFSFSEHNKTLKFKLKISIEDCYILLLNFLKEKHV